MISIGLLTKKPETTVDSETIVDLTSRVLEFKDEISISKTYIVSEEFEMRPDLVARVSYGNANKIDHILKFNGISNPFSLEAGTVLLIGDEGQLDACFSKPTTEDTQSDIRERFFDKNRLNKKDAKRLELLKKKSTEAANAANPTTPNLSEPGAKEITVKDGVVIFGNDVVANKDNCTVPLSKATVKAKLIQQKTFRNAG